MSRTARAGLPGPRSRSTRTPLRRLEVFDDDPADIDEEPLPRRRRSRPSGRRAVPSRRPDGRIVLGLLLIAAGAIAGARLLGTAAPAVPAWVVVRDVSAGTVLVADDLAQTRVADLGEAYARTDVPLVGIRTRVPLAAGEFVPLSAVRGPAAPATTRWLTLELDPARAPADLGRGDRVDLWSTPEIDSVIAVPSLVLPEVRVVGSRRADERSVSGRLTVTLDVAEGAVPAVLAALRSGSVDLVRVPVAGTLP